MKLIVIAPVAGILFALPAAVFGQDNGTTGVEAVTVEARANSWSGGEGRETGLDVTAGDRLAVTVDPSQMWSAGNDSPCSRTSNADGLTECYGSFSSGALSANFGSLVGRIGDGEPFLIGTAFDREVANSGPLRLYYWDSNAGDNSGSVSAIVRLARSTQPDAADGWLGKWSGASSYTETERIWDWWFTVSRSCDGYRIQTHTSGPEKVEILTISPTELEFLFHDELGTRIKISRLENDAYTGTVTQPNNSGLPRGRVDGRKIGEASPVGPVLSEIEIVEPGSLKPIDEIPMGEQFAVRLTYSDELCGEFSEMVTIATPGGSQQVKVTGNGRVIVSGPVTVTPAGL